eukprot:TRINITY_DN27057_c0_g1_i1.p2 TRINITY_DN27057_c0_g1~~TRINITY_DN27057_c0_g1_i1.p2  ORF type:complete len:150 (-),score=46.08 TRINITY_DN27057_c0_g1_i1:91-540(-)
MVSVLTPEDATVAFRVFDTENQGVLGREDLILALKRSGHETKASDIELLAAGSTSRRITGGQLHCEAFKAMTAQAGIGLNAKECLEHELACFFAAAGASGEALNVHELMAGLLHLGWEADEKEAQYLIEQFDKDGDGVLSKAELLDLLR